jgi:hypothetical protein
MSDPPGSIEHMFVDVEVDHAAAERLAAKKTPSANRTEQRGPLVPWRIGR